MNKILKNAWKNKIYLVLILLIFLCIGYGYTYFFTAGGSDSTHIRDLLIFAGIGVIMDILFVAIYSFTDKGIKGTGELKDVRIKHLIIYSCSR